MSPGTSTGTTLGRTLQRSLTVRPELTTQLRIRLPRNRLNRLHVLPPSPRRIFVLLLASGVPRPRQKALIQCARFSHSMRGSRAAFRRAVGKRSGSSRSCRTCGRPQTAVPGPASPLHKFPVPARLFAKDHVVEDTCATGVLQARPHAGDGS